MDGMETFGHWSALVMAAVALILAGVNFVRLQWLRTRVEQQLRTLGQRESWQRRVQKVPDHDDTLEMSLGK
jgi:hypothetical protein